MSVATESPFTERREMASACDGKTQGNDALFLPMYEVLWGRGGRGAASTLGRAGGRRWLGRRQEVDGSQALRDGPDDVRWRAGGTEGTAVWRDLFLRLHQGNSSPGRCRQHMIGHRCARQ